MFTGIVEEVGSVRRVERRAGGMRMEVQGSVVLEGTAIGDSILVNGACLTVERISGDLFTVFLSAETLDTTTFGESSAGARVNLERALALGDRLGGHLVSGHVEARGRIEDLRAEGEGHRLEVWHPAAFAPYAVPKGSVCVDGVSLTVVEALESTFTVSVIPETFEKTTFPLKTRGDFVNLEPDLILKYVMSAVRDLAADRKGEGITLDLLRKTGFIAD